MLLTMFLPRLVPVFLLVLPIASCAPSAREGGFDSPNPAAKMYAMEQAVGAGDQAAAARIVELLDSDDPAVRMLAIESLRRLTGTTLGYVHSDPPADRRQAIEEWVRAVESGQLVEEARTTADKVGPDD